MQKFFILALLAFFPLYAQQADTTAVADTVMSIEQQRELLYKPQNAQAVVTNDKTDKFRYRHRIMYNIKQVLISPLMAKSPEVASALNTGSSFEYRMSKSRTPIIFYGSIGIDIFPVQGNASSSNEAIQKTLEAENGTKTSFFARTGTGLQLGVPITEKVLISGEGGFFFGRTFGGSQGVLHKKEMSAAVTPYLFGYQLGANIVVDIAKKFENRTQVVISPRRYGILPDLLSENPNLKNGSIFNSLMLGIRLLKP